MLNSEICVYCGVTLNEIHNHMSSKTIEHMIPNVSLTVKRNRGEGDFHVCKSCNSEKSRLDELIGLICRMTGDNKEGAFLAAEKFRNAVERKDKLFVHAMNSIKPYGVGATIAIPLTIKDISKYGKWLAKGQYFLKRNEMLNEENHIISVNIINYFEVRQIKDWYRKASHSEAFDDLSKNESILNINNESFIISGDDCKNIMVCLNRTFIFDLKILENTRQNKTIANKIKRRLYSALGNKKY